MLSLMALGENPSLLLAFDVCQPPLAFLGLQLHHYSHMAVVFLSIFISSSLYVSVSVSKFPQGVRGKSSPRGKCFASQSPVEKGASCS